MGGIWRGCKLWRETLGSADGGMTDFELRSGLTKGVRSFLPTPTFSGAFLPDLGKFWVFVCRHFLLRPLAFFWLPSWLAIKKHSIFRHYIGSDPLLFATKRVSIVAQTMISMSERSMHLKYQDNAIKFESMDTIEGIYHISLKCNGVAADLAACLL